MNFLKIPIQRQIYLKNKLYHTSCNALYQRNSLVRSNILKNLKFKKLYNVQTYNRFYYNESNQQLPRLIYMPNILQWLRHKIQFWVLRRWDPEFNEGSFRFGTRQAVSTITNILQNKRYEDLTELMTLNSRTMLIYEFETSWPDVYKTMVGLEPEHIQLIIPRKVEFTRSLGRKICEVDLVFIGLKWCHFKAQRAMVFMETAARFKRDFDYRLVPEWTISFFKINTFQIINKQSNI